MAPVMTIRGSEAQMGMDDKQNLRIVCFFVFFPKQLQLMGFSIHSKKRNLFHHDFEACLLLSPFCWILRLVSLWFSFYWVQFHHDFEASLPLSPFEWIQCHHDFEACLPLSPFYWIQFHGSLCPPSNSLAQRSKSTIIRRLVSILFPAKFLAGDMILRQNSEAENKGCLGSMLP